MGLAAALAAAGLAATTPAAGQVTLVHAGSVLTSPRVAPREHCTIVVRDGRIDAIHDGYLSPAEVKDAAGAAVLDLSHQFVVPGLIDLHVHLTTETSPGDALRAVTLDAAHLALVARRHAEETLHAGFTTVLDLGTGRAEHEEAIFALREAIASGTVRGPRILAVGSPIAPTGSTRTDRFIDEVEAAVPPRNACDGPADCARAVREQIARGADAIVFYDSGSLRDANLAEQVFTDAEMQAIVEAAHARGRPVIADGHTSRAMNAAIRAGADLLDTAPWPNEETWQLLKGKSVFFEGHLHAFRVAQGYADAAERAGRPLAPADVRVRDVMSRPFSSQTAHEHGVRLAYGSDTGIVEHGDNGGDLEELVRMGLTPAEAIEVATVNSAAALGRSADFGTLEAGKSADLVAVDGDPLSDIRALRRIRYVMQAGRGEWVP